MKKLLLLTAAMLCALSAADSLAQHRHYRGGYRHGGHHPHHYGHYGHYGYYGAPYYAWGPYRPYSYWPLPLAFSYPAYPPAPVVVAPAYPAPRYYYGPPPVERPAPYPVPPRAEARPAPPAPKIAAVPQPKVERHTLAARELFEFDKARLRGPQPKLDEIAAALKEHRHIYDVDITGYTDRLGSEEYNLELSKRRAEAVKEYLVEKGVEPRRLRAAGKGKANPVVQCTDHDDKEVLIKCLEPNRRVEVESITFERKVPGTS